MHGKIALEEHFAVEDTLQDSAGFVPQQNWTTLSARLRDVSDGRLREMDANGVEMMVLSLNAPAVQAIHQVERAIETARRANDFVAEAVTKRPHRFQAFAALPMQDPDAATKELVRCVTELGFQGALVNGFSQVGEPETVVYCDDPRYAAFWATLETLDVPFYLHPRNPLKSWARIYAGHEWLLGPTWAFGQETAVHALRLIGSGLFDRHPRLQIILGHLGEGLPISMWRIDNRNAWVNAPAGHRARHPIAHYFCHNVHLTTSGNFRTQSLIDAILEIGADRIMFSTDWPFENVDHAANWFDHASISENDRVKIGRMNAARLLRLDLAQAISPEGL
jgi:gamma-resorcylate decarboxylase